MATNKYFLNFQQFESLTAFSVNLEDYFIYDSLNKGLTSRTVATTGCVLDYSDITVSASGETVTISDLKVLLPNIDASSVDLDDPISGVIFEIASVEFTGVTPTSAESLTVGFDLIANTPLSQELTTDGLQIYYARQAYPLGYPSIEYDANTGTDITVALFDITTQTDNTFALSAINAPQLAKLKVNGGYVGSTESVAYLATGTNDYALTSAQGYIIDALSDGQQVIFEVSGTNTGACTLVFDPYGSVDLTNSSGDALAAGDLVAGDVVLCKYSAGDDRFEIYAAFGSGSIVSSPLSIITSNHTAVAGERLAADTSGGAFTITFPASATAKDTIFIIDYADTWDTDNLTLDANGGKLQNQTDDVLCTQKGNAMAWEYVDATVGWKVTSSIY